MLITEPPPTRGSGPPEKQTAGSVLLIRPAAFGFNPETARSNHFAHPAGPETAAKATVEFDRLAQALEDAGVAVAILRDASSPSSPDAVFPNNWVSFHAGGEVVLFPMCASSRQRERQPERLLQLLRSQGFRTGEIVDLSDFEKSNHYLEGTGSLILDRPNRMAFAALSCRTHPEVIRAFDERLSYSTHVFRAADPEGRSIYHTNVMLSLGTKFAVVCLSAVHPEDRGALKRTLQESGRLIIDVSFSQMRQFACNILELRATRGRRVVAMSARALRSFRPDQLQELAKTIDDVVEAQVETIERVAGGSVRCMVADIHLPRLTTASSGSP